MAGPGHANRSDHNHCHAGSLDTPHSQGRGIHPTQWLWQQRLTVRPGRSACSSRDAAACPRGVLHPFSPPVHWPPLARFRCAEYLIEAAKVGLGHEGGAGRANRVTAIVGPHAGYRFCGEVLGSTYAHMPVDTKRIVVIGPSHHVFMEDAALTRATTLASPVGNVAVDVDAVAKLMKTGLFSWFDPKQDEEEHSVEMHLPFIVRSASLHKHAIPTVVPIIVGHVTAKQHRLMAAALAPLLAEPGTIIAVSTDFCHWGSRFRFTGVDEAAAKTGGLAHGIAALDKQGMEVSKRAAAARNADSGRCRTRSQP